MRIYSDPERENETYALSDVEVFYQSGQTHVDDCVVCKSEFTDEAIVAEHVEHAGYYYWYCFPGCMPESDAFGPYKTEEEAIEACREDASD